MLIDDEIFKGWKTIPGRHPFWKHISSNGDVINGDVIKTQCWKFRESMVHVRRWNTFLSLFKVWNKQIKEFYENDVKSREVMENNIKYIIKRLLHLYGNILCWTRSFGVVAKRTRLTQYIPPFGSPRSILRIKLDPRIGRGVPNVYSPTSAITYNTCSRYLLKTLRTKKKFSCKEITLLPSISVLSKRIDRFPEHQICHKIQDLSIIRQKWLNLPERHENISEKG